MLRKSVLARAIQFLRRLYNSLKRYRKLINQRMNGIITPNSIGFLVALIVLILILMMLFLPPYLGVADDGSFYKVMDATGLSYVQEDLNSENLEENNSNYYNKDYKIDTFRPYENQYLNTHVILVKIGIFLDNVVTKDNLFDIRFLALIYTALYIPGIWLLIREICRPVKNFSEVILLGIFGSIIFADVAYITYFSSFYPEALWFIGLIYVSGIMLSFQTESFRAWKLVALVLFGSGLSLTCQTCAFVGFVLALFTLRLAFLGKRWYWILGCFISALLLSSAAMTSLVSLDSDFSLQSKFNSMSRGVLFQSENPVKTLEDMGINGSYSLLADVSVYDDFPIVDFNEEALISGFYDKYSTEDITLHYLYNPIDMIMMQNSFINASYSIRRSSCGNYEETTGKPAMGQSLFWSAWSNFKSRSMPKTFGYIILMIVVTFLLWRKPVGMPEENWLKYNNYILKDVTLANIGICLLLAGFIIIMSGDSEFITYSLLASVTIDLATFIILSSALQRSNLIQGGDESEH